MSGYSEIAKQQQFLEAQKKWVYEMYVKPIEEKLKVAKKEYAIALAKEKGVEVGQIWAYPRSDLRILGIQYASATDFNIMFQPVRYGGKEGVGFVYYSIFIKQGFLYKGFENATEEKSEITTD